LQSVILHHEMAAGIPRECVSFVLKGQAVGTNFQQSNCVPFIFYDFRSNVDKVLDIKTLSHWIYDF
jgi:hypothetical protein